MCLAISSINKNTQAFNTHYKKVQCLELSDDSRYLVTGSYDKTVRI